MDFETLIQVIILQLQSVYLLTIPTSNQPRMGVGQILNPALTSRIWDTQFWPKPIFLTKHLRPTRLETDMVNGTTTEEVLTAYQDNRKKIEVGFMVVCKLLYSKKLGTWHDPEILQIETCCMEVLGDNPIQWG